MFSNFLEFSLKHPTDLQKEARDVRAGAARARRMLERVSDEADRQRIRRFADRLDKRAAQLETEAIALLPTISAS